MESGLRSVGSPCRPFRVTGESRDCTRSMAGDAISLLILLKSGNVA